MVENNSSFSKALPVPTATRDKGSSAIVTGNPVSLEINLSMFLNNAPPLLKLIPYQLSQLTILAVYFPKLL